MNIDKEMMENQVGNIPYEQPSLKKYGTMKDITLSGSGSGGDAGGHMQSPNNTAQDPDVVGDFTNLANDSIFSVGNDNDDLPLSVDGSQD